MGVSRPPRSLRKTCADGPSRAVAVAALVSRRPASGEHSACRSWPSAVRVGRRRVSWWRCGAPAAGLAGGAHQALDLVSGEVFPTNSGRKSGRRPLHQPRLIPCGWARWSPNSGKNRHSLATEAATRKAPATCGIRRKNLTVLRGQGAANDRDKNGPPNRGRPKHPCETELSRSARSVPGLVRRQFLASAPRRRHLTEGSRGLHLSRNEAGPRWSAAIADLLVSWPLPWASISSCLSARDYRAEIKGSMHCKVAFGTTICGLCKCFHDAPARPGLKSCFGPRETRK